MVRLDRILGIGNRAFLDETQDQGIFLLTWKSVLVDGFFVRQLTPPACEALRGDRERIRRRYASAARAPHPLATAFGRDLAEFEIALIEEAVARVDLDEDVGTLDAIGIQVEHVEERGQQSLGAHRWLDREFAEFADSLSPRGGNRRPRPDTFHLPTGPRGVDIDRERRIDVAEKFGVQRHAIGELVETGNAVVATPGITLLDEQAGLAFFPAGCPIAA